MIDIDDIVNVFNQGGIVIFPTDTAFGIGCRIDRPEAIKRLFKLRRRPETQAVPVLVDSEEMAKKYWQQINPEVQEFMSKYWPGALTVVYKSRSELVPRLVCGGGENIGLRMPDHNELLWMIGRVGVPVLGPSANFHGEATIYNRNDLDQELVKLVDAVMDGECPGDRRVSTVVDCSMQPYKVLRTGKINI